MQDFLLLLNGRNKSIPAAARFSFTQGHYSVNGVMQTFSDLFTTTRATAAWDIAGGALVEYAANEPVLNSNGLAAFDASTNFITHNDGAFATYPVRGGDAGDGTPFITGFNNAVAFDDSPASAAFAYKTYTYSASTDYTFSFYIKMNDSGVPVAGASSSDAAGDFCLIMYGAIIAPDAIKSLGDGIYRVYATVNSGASSTLNFGAVKYTGNSIRGFTVLGYQLEQAGFASPIIITEGATVTRNADVIVNNAAITSWYNDSEGTVYARADSADSDAFNSIATFGQGFADHNFIAYTSGTGTLSRIRSGNVESCAITSATTASDTNKIALAYKVNDFEAAENGASIGTDTSGATATGITALRMGCYFNNALQLNGYIQEFRYYNTRLPQADMITITG